MSKCGKCQQFFKSGGGAADNAEKTGNCVMEKTGNKGKYWISKPVTIDSKECAEFKPFIKVA